MDTIALALIALVACLHAYFLVLECFLWTRPRTRKAFGLSEEFAQSTKVMALNQGVYNGFLAAGLVWTMLATDERRFSLGFFFLSCVIVAGVVGGVTVHKRIFYAQATPAIAALLVLIFSRQ